MHDIWLMPPQQRLKKWRHFRKDLIGCDTKTVLSSCLDMWTTAPISSRFLDIHNSSSWLKPWDLVWSGDFDEDSTEEDNYTLEDIAKNQEDTLRECIRIILMELI